MEPFTTGAIAIVTVIMTKVVEKAGEKVGEILWNKTCEFLVTLKTHIPHTVVGIEKAPSQPLDYDKAVLGYLPLGLELVGRYVAKKPLAQMLQRLTSQRLENVALQRLSSGMQQSFSTAQLGVLAAFELSWQELRVAIQLVAALLSSLALNIFVSCKLTYSTTTATSGLSPFFKAFTKAQRDIHKRFVPLHSLFNALVCALEVVPEPFYHTPHSGLSSILSRRNSEVASASASSVGASFDFCTKLGTEAGETATADSAVIPLLFHHSNHKYVKSTLSRLSNFTTFF